MHNDMPANTSHQFSLGMTIFLWRVCVEPGRVGSPTWPPEGPQRRDPKWLNILTWFRG